MSKTILKQLRVIILGTNGSYPTVHIPMNLWDYSKTKRGISYNNIKTLINYIKENKDLELSN